MKKHDKSALILLIFMLWSTCIFHYVGFHIELLFPIDIIIEDIILDLCTLFNL